MIVISQNENYILHADKINGLWWVELTEKSTGLTWLTTWKTKAQALAIFKDMELKGVLKALQDDFKVKPQQVYKANVNWRADI